MPTTARIGSILEIFSRLVNKMDPKDRPVINKANNPTDPIIFHVIFFLILLKCLFISPEEAKKSVINKNSKRKVNVRNSVGLRMYRTDFFKRALTAPKIPMDRIIPKVSDMTINNTKYYKRTQHSTGFCLFSGWCVL